MKRKIIATLFTLALIAGTLFAGRINAANPAVANWTGFPATQNDIRYTVCSTAPVYGLVPGFDFTTDHQVGIEAKTVMFTRDGNWYGKQYSNSDQPTDKPGHFDMALDWNTDILTATALVTIDDPLATGPQDFSLTYACSPNDLLWIEGQVSAGKEQGFYNAHPTTIPVSIGYNLRPTDTLIAIIHTETAEDTNTQRISIPVSGRGVYTHQLEWFGDNMKETAAMFVVVNGEHEWVAQVDIRFYRDSRTFLPIAIR